MSVCMCIIYIHTFVWTSLCIIISAQDRLIKKGCQSYVWAGMGTQQIGHRHGREIFHYIPFYALCLYHMNVPDRETERER